MLNAAGSSSPRWPRQERRHLQFANNTPMTNLLLTLHDKVDEYADTLGDSTGRLQPDVLAI